MRCGFHTEAKMATVPGIEFRYEDVPVSDITVPRGRRKHDDADVDSMVLSIESVGLIHPLCLDDDYNLVAGRRRLQAHVKMGRGTAPCRIGPFTKVTADIAEIDENYLRKN